MRIFCTIAAHALLFWLGAEPAWHRATVAISFDVTAHPRDHRPDRAVNFILDVLADTTDTAYHGRHGIVLESETGSFSRGNFGAADSCLNFPALLSPSDWFRRLFLDKS